MITERKVQTDIGFYNHQSQNSNIMNLPGQPSHYKTTIVSSSINPHSFWVPNIKEEIDSIRKSQEFRVDSARKSLEMIKINNRNISQDNSELGDSVVTPRDLIAYKFQSIPNDASTNRPGSQSYIPDLFDNSRLRKNSSGLLPHLLPITPAYYKKSNSHASITSSVALGNILDDLKKELEEEDKLNCNN